MKMTIVKILSFLVVLTSAGAIQAATTSPNQTESVSGKIVHGYRVLEIKTTTENLNLTVYRGDYIKFVFDQTIGDPILSIPSLAIKQKLVRELSNAPYFKMKKTGMFQFSLGKVAGNITVIEYRQPHYRAVTAKEAAKLISDGPPLILDVRTPSEFKSGHLHNAVLIPVQELDKRVHEISKYKNLDILIYCATGNRSTVASKILIDEGFMRIINLRYGIHEWRKLNYPVMR